jgi:hypothetical protein
MALSPPSPPPSAAGLGACWTPPTVSPVRLPLVVVGHVGHVVASVMASGRLVGHAGHSVVVDGQS